jgi:hypothetical protein
LHDNDRSPEERLGGEERAMKFVRSAEEIRKILDTVSNPQSNETFSAQFWNEFEEIMEITTSEKE